MTNPLHNLLNIGLTKGEAKVYLALAELGSSTVGPIVKKAEIASSNVYDILNRLAEKGVVSYIIKSKIKYYQAAPPNRLLDFLTKKETQIQEQKKALNKVLPELVQLQKLTETTQAEIFLGKKGLRSAYEKFLINKDKNTENLFFYVHKKRYAKEADLFYFSVLDFFTRVPQRGIANEYARISPWFQQVKKNVKTKYVDFPLPGNIEVCNDSVLLISWEEKITSVLINSEDIANNYRTYFNAIWKLAKP